MKEELELIVKIFNEKGIDFYNSDMKIFINNWMPERNQDYQQDYFLNDLKRALQEVISTDNKDS